MIYVVLGMHKSGTTLVSQMLHMHGINMGTPEENKNYDQGEQFERLETQELNMTMLDCDQSTFSLDVFKKLEKIQSDPELINEMTGLVNDLNAQYSDWGFKDPRTCLTWDAWEPILGKDVSLIAVWRHPNEVFGHYIKPKKWWLIRRAFRTLRAWYNHNKEILAISSRSKIFLCDYTQLMLDDSVLAALRNYVGKEIPDLRRKGLYRNHIHYTGLYKFSLMLMKLAGKDVERLHKQLSSLSNKCITQYSS